MKLKTLIHVALLGAIMASCSNDELENNLMSPSNEISFRAVSNKASRANIITPDNITTTDFSVYAYTEDGSAYMGTNDKDLYWNGVYIDYNTENGVWDYVTPSNKRYWPNSTDLNFYAVSPATVEYALRSNYGWMFSASEQQIAYCASDEYGKVSTNPLYNYSNIDVMYAIAQGKNKTNCPDGVVNLKFHHALAQVMFQAKTEMPSMQVELKSLKICNLHISGTFTLPSTDVQATKDNWTLKGSEATQGSESTVALAEGEQTGDQQQTGKGIQYAVNEANIVVNHDGNNAITDINTKKPIMVIPQTLKAWTVTGEDKTKEQADINFTSYLMIECNILQNGEYLVGSADKVGEIYVPFGPTWQPGKRYTYTLTFGGGYDDQGDKVLTPITFEASCDVWEEKSEDVENF